MKTMYPPDHHHNGFVATHALRHMIYGCVRLCTMVTIYIIYIIYIYIKWLQNISTSEFLRFYLSKPLFIFQNKTILLIQLRLVDLFTCS